MKCSALSVGCRTFTSESDLPDRSGYRFYTVVHVSRMKKGRDHGERPTRRLATGIAETDRFNFDVDLLPEISWEPGEASGKY